MGMMAFTYQYFSLSMRTEVHTNVISLNSDLKEKLKKQKFILTDSLEITINKDGFLQIESRN